MFAGYAAEVALECGRRALIVPAAAWPELHAQRQALWRFVAALARLMTAVQPSSGAAQVADAEAIPTGESHV